VIANFAGSHFVFAKTILPVMKKSEGSTMLFITGGVGERTGCCCAYTCAMLIWCVYSGALAAAAHAADQLSWQETAPLSHSPTFRLIVALAGQRVLSADSGLATVGGSAV